MIVFPIWYQALISLHMNLLVRPRSSDGQSDEPVKVIDYYLYNI